MGNYIFRACLKNSVLYDENDSQNQDHNLFGKGFNAEFEALIDNLLAESTTTKQEKLNSVVVFSEKWKIPLVGNANFLLTFDPSTLPFIPPQALKEQIVITLRLILAGREDSIQYKVLAGSLECVKLTLPLIKILYRLVQSQKSELYHDLYCLLSHHVSS